MSAEPTFPLAREYFARRWGAPAADAQAGETLVVETPLRLRREEGYGYIRTAWWSVLADGGSVLSVPPGAGEAAQPLAAAVDGGRDLFDADLAAELTAAIAPALERADTAPIDRSIRDLHFACDASSLRAAPGPECVRLAEPCRPAAEGLAIPALGTDGVAYAAVADGKLVSIAWTHHTGVMQRRIADLGVTTAAAYRRRGFARATVAAVVGHYARQGGEAVYGCRPDNAASVATARSVGFMPFARSLILASPRRGS